MLLFMLLALVPVFAQGLGRITGTVTDPSGAAIAGAKVTAVERGTGQSRLVNSSTEGFFTIASLRPPSTTLPLKPLASAPFPIVR